MNLKKAKELRKQVGYKPNRETEEYSHDEYTGAVIVKPDSPKGAYKSLKKEAKK